MSPKLRLNHAMLFSAYVSWFTILGPWQFGMLGLAGKILYNDCMELQKGRVGRDELYKNRSSGKTDSQ